MSISQIRAALAQNMAAVPGLRVSSYIPDNPNPPIAVVSPPSIKYEQSFGRGLNQYDFQIVLLATRADERTGQDLIDGYCEPTGSTSVRAAIESDRTLGGLVDDLHVTDMTGVSPTTLADGQVYLTATWVVQVYSQ